MPEVTAEKFINSEFVLFAIICANVDLPIPGFPQNIIEEILSLSISFLKTIPSPIRCFCPTNSSKFLGLKRDANG